MTIGENIRIQRITKGYSQEYMSYALDISQAAYSKLERDETEMSIRRIYEIAEILEISPFMLMPKPKYGTGINLDFIRRGLYKLRRFWFGGVRKQKAEADRLFPAKHSDKSNTAGQ